MGTRISALKLYVFIISLALASHLFKVAQSSKVWDEVPFPEDLEEEDKLPGGYVDDEEYYEASGESNSGDEDGSTPEPNTMDPGTTIYYRALVNFTNSFQYGPELDDITSPAFQEISSAVVDTLESDYNTIPGVQTVNVVLIKQIGRDVFVELDVGSDNNSNEPQIRGVLYSVVKEGTIASYDTSVVGFDFRRLGEADNLPPMEPSVVPVKPIPRDCLPDEFTCRDGGCISRDYVCDNRPDCNDFSDEGNCGVPVPEPPTPPTPPRTRPPPELGPCRADQATCQNGQCISRDYVCDGEQDCADGSDESRCGTPSPCEPNEFKCQNGRCALKLWRCDGDNDCQDNSDEIDCPTKGPRDTCAPEQFVCLTDRNCIPASYQCDEEPDCADRSDEYGCAPPTVIVPPQESITTARGDTVTFTCVATGVPTPIITWRLNWGHLPANSRITMTNEKGQGMLTIRDVKEGDQGAYTCEAINAKGLVFAIPDGVLSLSQRPNPGNCPDGHFSVGDHLHCMPCFCFGITKNCQSTGRYRSQITLRFTEEDDFKGVNVSFPTRPGTSPPLSPTQMLINIDTEEFQLVDLSRRFLDQDSYWSLPRQFLGNKVDSYGGYLKYKVNYFVQRGGSEPKEKPDVVLTGNGQRFIYRRGDPTYPDTTNQREIKFTEENWQHSSGRAVTRDDLMMALANLETIQIRTIYDNRMASVGLSDISMDITTKEFTVQENPRDVEECRCPPGYSGLSCETCSPGFERVPGLFMGSCAGCNCNGHASACDPISGHCLSCQHNTEGPQCNKCKSGYFGDPSQGRYDDCKPCPCPYTETSRRFSDSCFLDHDNRATCDACRTGYTGRRCEICAPGYEGNPLEPNGKCVPVSPVITKCDNRGTINPISRPCYCKGNVVGGLCDECKIGAFHLSADNPDGCLQCFCMGVTKQCASSTWSRDQVRGGVNGQLFTLSNAANTRTISEGIVQRASTEVVYRSFSRIPNDIYYWVLPENFRGDKVTAYGGELQYRLRYELQPRSLIIDGQPDVVLQGNGIFLEHYSQTKPLPRVSTPITVSFRESAWRRSDGQPCTREHLLMALADITVFMIRATYADNMAESSLSDIQMDVAVPHSTGSERALEVEECACPQGYRGPSCQDCDVGYTRTPGLYLGTCEKCECYGHASGCDSETGDCLGCQHNTAGRNCENCLTGFYGNPKTGDPQACRPCPCLGPTNTQRTCFLDSDGQPTCECPAGYTGRRCERCASGYIGNPPLGQKCTVNDNNGDCYRCDKGGSEGCSSNGVCRCKMNVEGSTCSTCKQGTFYLSPSNKDGCLSCFCMGVTQQCSSSNHYRDVIYTTFAPGNYQGFALVNRQRTNRIDTGFSVELSTEGTQLSYTNFNYLGQEPHYWQLPNTYHGDKIARSARTRRAQKHPADEVRKLDDEIWSIISNFSNGQSPFLFSSSSKTSSSSFGGQSSLSRSSVHATSFHSGLTSSLTASDSHSADSEQSYQPDSTEVDYGKNTVGPLRGPRPGPNNKYVLVYNGFSSHLDDVLFWQLPEQFKGDKVGTYGGKLKYTISYVPGERGSHVDDVDVQITGNDITLVARIPWGRRTGFRVSHNFEIVFREEYWQRPDGMPATREHLMMVLADLDDILIRASYDTEMRSSSISGVRMEVAVPQYTGLAQALEVEQCQCPAGYRGLSCQDCAPGYTRTGGGLYLGHCEPCECNGHSDSCHPETGICTSCQHNTRGELCEQCADGFFGDPTAGTPEDCQPCACPGTDPNNQFSRTCESLGNGGYQCTACQPGYTGQYCERCAPGYVGSPQARIPCRSAAASLVVKIYPERVQVAQGNPVTLRCQVSGNPPHYFHWSREDGRPISNTAERPRQGEELHFPSVRASDAGVYICTCRDQRSTNRSKAEIVVATLPSKPIEVFIEEPKSQRVTVGATVNFICTAKSRLPAYTLVWTRRGNRKLPNRAMDFNGILTIQNVQPGDADTYVCTGSNMLGMDEGMAHLYVPAAEGSQPVATVNPRVLTVIQGERAEFRCTVTGNPTPAVEWIGAPGYRISSKAIIRNGVLTISSVDRSDEGEYICKALNTHGEHTARGVLHVQSTSQHHGLPLVQVSTQSVEAHEGDTLRLYCRAIGNPTPELTWKKRGGSLPPQAIPSHGFHQFKSNSLDVLQRRIEELQTRGERTDIGTLLVPNIRSSDAGTYICVGTNTAGSSEAYIEVFVKKGEIFPSGVTIQPSTPSVIEGEALDLDCSVPGSSPTSVKWSRAGRLLSSNHQVFGTRLRILQASSDDVGDYICHVESGPSSLQASVFVSVTSSASRYQTPIISIEPHSAAVKQGESASFKCKVHIGAPPVLLEWKLANNQSFPDNVVIGPENSVITIINAQTKNHGTYKCLARNLYGKTQSVVTLIVRESPKAIVTPTGPVRVRVGDPINLECQAAGEPRPSVKWHRLDNNRRTMLSSPVPGDSIASVQILVARPEDSGTYVCTAQNNQGTNETRVDVIVEGEYQIPTVPRVSVHEPMIVVAEGSTATLYCVAHGFPKPTITWSKDRSSLPWRHKVVDNSLVIPNVHRQDSGHYICNATNHMGTSQVTIMLEVGESPKAIVTPTGPMRVRVGDPINLECQAAGEPRPSVRWHRLDNNRRTMLSSPVPGDSIASVQILVARPEDSGTYVCTAQSNKGTTETRVDVIVEGEYQIPTIPRASVHEPIIVVAEGSTATLHCEAHGFPKPTITWSKDRSSLSWRHKVVDNSLVIPNVRRQDSGHYICNATNHMGTSQVTIMLEVGESPKAIVTPTGPMRVRVGNPINLECQAAGEPRPSVRWHRLDNNRRTMLSSPVPGDSIASVQILVARPEDSGTYVCTAQSNQGTTETRVDVIVEGEHQIQTVPRASVREPLIVVAEGSTATLHCEAHGFPKPTITWSKKHSSLPWKHKIVSNLLVIPNVGRQDSGQYVCNATNHMGTSEATIMLEVGESPKAVITPTGPVRVQVGDPINLECQAAGEPRPSVRWHRLDNNRRTMLSSPVPADSSAIMQILVARPEDSGTYVCTAQSNQGTTETQVDVIVEGGPQIPTVPRASVREPMIVVVEGSTATLHCEAHGFPKPTITWSKERSSLPWGHKIVNNNLVLSNVGRQDSGQYVCNATNHMGTSEATIMLEVDTPPYATSLPDDVSVRVGEVIRLQCLAHGTPPLRYEWSKVNGTLPRTAQVQGGDLQINLATESDAGTYKCISSNNVGMSEALARVSVRSPLSVKVSPQVEVKALGTAVEFTCSAKGGSQIQIEWLKEGGVLPPNHHIYNGVLRIENLEQSNEGIYTCRVRSLYGQAQDSAKLTIQALPKVMINVRTSVQTVMVGNSVEFECHATGDPQPSVRWSKVGGTLPDHIVVKGNVLRIEQVTEADQGKYRCTASNNVGSVQSEVDLNIQSLPQILAQPETKEVTVGSDAIFPCIASGYPVPTITWSKVENELPSKCRQDGHVLRVPAVTHADAGVYVCTAANKQGKVEAFTKLLVHERVMPQFTQEPISYLTLPTIKNSYNAFSIKITFRPDNVDGMIIYNGQKRTTGADFISFGLVGGRPEFRFDVGSGMANIRYPTSIKLGEFHTVELHRNLTHGSLVVDGEHPVNGSSQGKFKGLDLNEELFVGGYPNYSVIAKTAEIKTGFVGCIKQLVIQGEEVIFKDLEKSSVGVSNCPTCKDRPCQHGGKCEDSDASLYKCKCQRGYTGSNCQHHASLRCHSEACGPDATCINRPTGFGYDCRCHLGKSGNKCMDGALVTTPLFDGEDSYIAYPPLTNIHNDLRIEMEFKPMDPDGLMFFCGGQKVKVEDFVTLSMVNGHVEFRYELGTGQAVLRSQDPVSLDKWHRVVAERLDKDGSLKVDHAREITRSSPGKAQGLNIFTPMYLGGVPSMDILPKPANVSMLFEGCIGEVFINGKKMDISYSFIENRAISQCRHVDSLCDRRPCLHGGTCMSTAEYEYQCLCSEGYEGDRCEVVKEACRVSSQCQNGGSCVNKFCVCPAGYTGRHCEKDSPLQHSAYFHDNGYLALPKPMFPRSSPDSPETIELEINTASSDGLIFWQGVEPAGAISVHKKHASRKELGDQGKGKDFVSLGLQNGRVVFSYQLGSGEANIESREIVNDGQWHKITAVRTGRHGYLQIDGGSVHRGQSKGKSVMVDTKGNIYLGGAPEMKSLTDGKFSAGITGCVRNVSLLNARPGEQPAQPIDLQVHAEEGINVERCLT